ncbi:MAG: hypothetical protein EBT56_05330 [Betaproteobacteria bacterium]|nr:hypothetical protein [Betaproteobacteria bacterium]
MVCAARGFSYAHPAKARRNNSCRLAGLSESASRFTNTSATSDQGASVLTAPTPFRLQIAASAIDDLYDRLARTRWPDEAPDQTAEGHWRYGTPKYWLQHLHQYWLAEFDWREQEARLTSTCTLSTQVLKGLTQSPCYFCTAGQDQSLNF